MSKHTLNQSALIDPDTFTKLGGNWWGATLVAPDGTTWPWILNPKLPAHDAPIEWPEHDNTRTPARADRAHVTDVGGLIDQDDLVELDTDGNWLAAMTVEPDGTSWPWLYTAQEKGAGTITLPAHEQVDHPPIDTLIKTWQCGHPTRRGGNCVRWPKRGTIRCWQHGGQA